MDLSPGQPDKEEVDDLIRRKRKVREHKACYPCRQRKVRCDSNIPCKTCIDRNHPEICAWNPPPKRVDTGASHGAGGGLGAHLNGHDGATVTLAGDEFDRLCAKLNAMERTLSELRHDLRRATAADGPDGARSSASTAGGDDGGGDAGGAAGVKDEPTGPGYIRAMEMSERSQMTGQRVHVGGGSVPALIKALRADNTTTVQEVFGSNVLPLFGLDNENATYPFISLWGNPQGAHGRIDELQQALPSDADCIETFRQYRDGAWVLNPTIVEVDKFESDLLLFLANRRSGQFPASAATDTMYGYDLSWTALLFAVLAAGAQFSPLMPKSQRELISGVYGCSSFECLRMVNYLANVSLNVIQSMLVLGSVLANGMNAGAAWSFLGMTIRLAQSLGLHRAREKGASTPEDLARNRVWWGIIWQDSLLSISFDRASSAATADCPYPPLQQPALGLNYHEAMYRICKVGLDTIRNRVAPQSIESRLGRCSALRDEIQAAQDGALPHLRQLPACTSIREQGEHYMLCLHTSYMKSELCRPAISPSTSAFDKTNDLRRLCIANLIGVVDAFLGLATVSALYTRSWAITHRALSAALLLGILGEPLRSAECQASLARLIEVMTGFDADNALSAGGLGVGAGGRRGDAKTSPVQRSVSALRKLCALESRTPRPMEESAAPSYAFDLNGGGGGDGAAQAGAGAGGASTTGVGTPWLEKNFDESSFFLPSPLSGFEDDSSPYALMDSILTGGGYRGM